MFFETGITLISTWERSRWATAVEIKAMASERRIEAFIGLKLFDNRREAISIANCRGRDGALAPSAPRNSGAIDVVIRALLVIRSARCCAGHRSAMSLPGR